MASVMTAASDGLASRQPAARRDAVGFIVESFGKHGREIRHHSLFEQLRMQRGHAVGAVRADDGQMRHANLPGRALLDQADALDPPGVAGIPHANIVEKAAIDFVNDFEMARQESP